MKTCLMTTAALVGVLAGCGTEVTFVSSGATGAGGSGGSSGTTTTSSGVGAAGGGSCERTGESFEMLLETAYGESYGCSLFFETGTGLYTFEGQVLESTPGGLLIDECPPTADCLPMVNKLSFGATGLQNPVPVGAFVHVEVRVDIPMGCSHELLVTNLPSWFGVPNPYMPGDDLYLAGADGVAAALPGSPFDVTAVPLGCSPNPYDDSYLLRFSSPWSSASIDVPMGQTADWFLEGPGYPTMVTLRNLRSYETGFEDDYWNWGFWAYGYPALTED